MQAVILAAGQGRRLAPLTDTIPKPLIKVQGRTILERLLYSLPDEVTEVIIVTEYLEEKITEHIGDNYNNLNIKYAHQGEKKGTLGALISAKELLNDESFLIMGSDDLFNKAELSRIVKNKYSFGVHKKFLPGKQWLIIEVGNNNKVTSMRKPTDEEFRNPQYMATGVYVTDKTIFDVEPYILANGELGLPQTLRGLFGTKEYMAVEMKDWLQINTHEELAYAEANLGKKHI